MFITIIIAAILFLLYKFFTALAKENKELNETPTPNRFSEIIAQLNAYAFGLEGKVTVIDKNTFNLYQDGKNQIINFHYSTGVLTITWKYKWYQNEIAYKKDYSDLQNIGINQQVQIANDMIKEMDVVIARHKQKVNASLNPDDALVHLLLNTSNKGAKISNEHSSFASELSKNRITLAFEEKIEDTLKNELLGDSASDGLLLYSTIASTLHRYKENDIMQRMSGLSPIDYKKMVENIALDMKNKYLK